MALRRWYPIRDVRRFDSLADRFWQGYGVGSEVTYRSLPLDVVHEGEDILVHASVPGIAPEDIQVSIEDGVLTIEGEAKTEHANDGESYLVRERGVGRLRRALRLPDTVDADSAESRYENGVVTVKLPKVEAKKARKLNIEVAR